MRLSLSPAQVQARFGATAAQQHAVRGWLSRSGLAVTNDDGFVITAMGTAARAETALQAGLALSQPAGSAEQVVPARAMSVPAAVAGAITTIRVSTAAVPLSPHQPLEAAAVMVPGSKAAATRPKQCSAYYGQKKATGLPHAYGRTITWAPCGYQPAQLRDAYGATKSGLTGAGASVAVISETGDPTALSDANRWARQRHVPPFAAGQFTGDPLLDALDTVVQHRLADVVTSSRYETFMPFPASMVTSWEGVLKRAAAEGITVNFSSGDFSNLVGLEYPASDPWVTTVGGTSLSSPLFAGFEADLIQGRGGKRLGFANPLLYRAAHSAAFHDVTSSPQGRGYTEAVIAGLTGTFDHGALILSTMGQCGAHKTLPCGPGYDRVTGLGSPGPAFFRSFGSRPR
jgi:subtilase family serine protease